MEDSVSVRVIKKNEVRRQGDLVLDINRINLYITQIKL